eukprot:COSAG01_NODE_4280_length_5182_cov_7.106433_2_plen_326_part_00
MMAGAQRAQRRGHAGVLSDAEIEQWVRDGYLIKRGVLDPALCAAARERLWSANRLPQQLRRDDPSSWRRFSADEECDGAGTLRRRCSWRVRACAREELLLELLPRSCAVLSVVEELLGGAAAVGFSPPGYYSRGDFSGDFSAAKTRGIYATMPYGHKHPRTPHRLHNDSTLESRDRVGCVGYIGDVCPGGGGFAVWPGTHLTCWNKIDHWEARWRLDSSAVPIDAPALVREWERIKTTVHPVDCAGTAGDVVFYHSRLGHHAGPNYSQNIRLAVLADFALTPRCLRDSELRSERCLRQDMWFGWSARVRAAAVAAQLHTRSSARL